MRRRSWLLDGALALVLAVLAVVQVTVTVPAYGDVRGGVLTAAGLLAAAAIAVGVRVA